MDEKDSIETPDGGGALQFDRAEVAAGLANEMPCRSCAKPVTSQYFEMGGAVWCTSCKQRFDDEWNRGSRAGRFLRAVAFGLPAAVIGAILYYAVAAATGYELGLVAIVIGLMVGGAVRFGARRRGGWAYQGLAMALTYVAIVTTYVPAILGALRQTATQDATTAEVSTTGDARAAESAEEAAATAAPGGETAGEAAEETAAALRDVPAMLLFLAVLLGLAMAAPFLAGFDNIIGLIIIGIGLYEAWRLNKPLGVELSGPYRIALTDQVLPSAPAPAES
ncbi:MAG: hypothetical protein HYV63_29035 [Candidatus Schekmanbacteria bacterium]|nr:hypothetical protein [Candidatus Schekmanbacteria bacterium]